MLQRRYLHVVAVKGHKRRLSAVGYHDFIGEPHQWVCRAIWSVGGDRAELF